MSATYRSPGSSVSWSKRVPSSIALASKPRQSATKPFSTACGTRSYGGVIGASGSCRVWFLVTLTAEFQ